MPPMETANSSDPGGTSSKTTRSSGDGESSSSGLGALPASLLVHDILLRLDLKSLSSATCLSKTQSSAAGRALSSLSSLQLVVSSKDFSPDVQTLDRILSACRGITSLTVNCLRVDCCALEGFLGLHIRELNLLRCTAMSPSALGSICPNLRVLMLAWAERGSFDEFIGNFHQLLSCCVHLESLCLKIRGVEDPVYAFSSGIWPKNIKVLKLRPALEGDMISLVKKIAGNEKWPAVIKSPSLPSAIDTLASKLVASYRGLQGLESVRLPGFSEVSDAGFPSFFHSCKNLKKFEVHSSRYMSDLAFHDLTEAPCSLTELRIHSCNLITSETVKKLAFCSNLEVFDILVCRGVAESGLCSLSSVKMLNTLDLPGTAITDGGLLTLGQGCAPIRRLSLSYCQGVTDKGIHQLPNSRGIISKTLYRLELGYLRHVSEEAVRAVASFGAAITELCLRSCFDMTDSSVEALARKGSLEDGSQPIRRLDLFFCIGLSVESLQMLKRPLFRGLHWVSVGDTRLAEEGGSVLSEIYEERPWLTVCTGGCEMGCRDGWEHLESEVLV